MSIGKGIENCSVSQGRRQGFRPGWANILLDQIRREAPKIFFWPTLVFSLPTLAYVTVAHPAHRSTLVVAV